MKLPGILQALEHPIERLVLWFRYQFLPAFGGAWRDFFVTDRVPNLAAALAFFALLSFIPLLIFITATFGYILESSEAAYQRVLDFIQQTAPHAISEIFPLISDMIEFRFTAGWVSALVLVWIGSRVFDVLESSLNRVWMLKEDRPILKKTGLALLLVPGMAIFLGASLSLSTLYTLTKKFELPGFNVQLEDIPFLWNLLGQLLPVIISLLGFYLVYRLIAATRVHPKDAFIGAMTAAIMWEALKRGYDFWVTNFWEVSSIYGGLGTLAVFVIWIYLSCMILLFGAEVSYNWQKVEERRDEDFEYYNSWEM